MIGHYLVDIHGLVTLSTVIYYVVGMVQRKIWQINTFWALGQEVRWMIICINQNVVSNSDGFGLVTHDRFAKFAKFPNFMAHVSST